MPKLDARIPAFTATQVPTETSRRFSVPPEGFLDHLFWLLLPQLGCDFKEIEEDGVHVPLHLLYFLFALLYVRCQ